MDKLNFPKHSKILTPSNNLGGANAAGRLGERRNLNKAALSFCDVGDRKHLLICRVFVLISSKFHTLRNHRRHLL